jgi:hypothetical protein
MAGTSYAEFGVSTTGTEVAGRFAGRIGGKVSKLIFEFLCLSVLLGPDGPVESWEVLAQASVALGPYFRADVPWTDISIQG